MNDRVSGLCPDCDQDVVYDYATDTRTHLNKKSRCFLAGRSGWELKPSTNNHFRFGVFHQSKDLGSYVAGVGDQANGHLIAAAPDLLEACKQAKQWWCEQSIPPEPWVRSVMDAIEKATTKECLDCSTYKDMLCGWRGEVCELTGRDRDGRLP